MSDAPHDHDQRLVRMEKDIHEIKTALLGQMGMPGLVHVVQETEKWRLEREKERHYQRGIVATIGALAGAASAFLVKQFAANP